jgi:hypothetical protein
MENDWGKGAREQRSIGSSGGSCAMDPRGQHHVELGCRRDEATPSAVCRCGWRGALSRAGRSRGGGVGGS